MPIYEYACAACDHKFEAWQKMSDAPVRTCPKCKKKKVEKLISQTAFQLKGGGWYADLYSSSKGGGKDKDGGGDSKSAESGSKSESGGKSDGASDGGNKNESGSKSAESGSGAAKKEAKTTTKTTSKDAGKSNSPKKSETRAA